LEGQALVNWINAQGKWKAEFNGPMQNPEFAKAQLGSLTPLGSPSIARLASLKTKAELKAKKPWAFGGEEIPKEFDARTNWPDCTDVLSRIPDQSDCGSCWAVAAAAVMSDRVCIHSGGKDQTQISAADVMTCGYYGTENGCHGGYEEWAFYHYQYDGVVSGSSYGEDSGCKPYPYAPCEHHQNGTTTNPPCPSEMYEAPDCQTQCQPNYKEKTFEDDKHFGASFDAFNNEMDIQRELLQNGPIVGAFIVYEDFVHYKGGIYEHLYGKKLGGHAVRLIGWGEENGKKHWTLANNWNDQWGEKGLFRIIRGQDECRIESWGTAGLPVKN